MESSGAVSYGERTIQPDTGFALPIIMAYRALSERIIRFGALLGIVVLCMVPANATGAMEKLEIRDVDLNQDYLPYGLEVIHQEGAYEGTVAIPRSWQVVSPSVAGLRKGSYFISYNTPPGIDRPSIMGLYDFPIIVLRYDTPFYMIIRDWQLYPVRGSDAQAVVITGFRNDSALVVRMDLETGVKSELYLCSGTDEKNDGVWEPEMEICLVEDYDYDQSQEAFVAINSVRECSVRVLYCVDLERLEIEWSLPVASLLRRETMFSCRDSLNPAILFTAYNPKQGYEDDNFNDMYAYLTKVDRQGEIVFNRQLASSHLFCKVARSRFGDAFYLYHAMDLRDGGEASDSEGDGYFVSKIDRDGNLLRTTRTSERPRDIWLHRYGTSQEPMVYIEFQDGFQRVYDSRLGLVAQSDSVGHLGFLGRIKMEGLEDSALVFRDGIYSAELIKLASFDGRPNYFQVVGYDKTGNATSLIANPNRAQILNLHKRKGSRIELMLSLFYFRNQKAILMIISGLIVGLVVMNYYRLRIKSDLHVIVNQRDELRRTDKALKKAQEQIVEQEKYRQAKSIAGGFAHEIRNALFPAEAAFSTFNNPASDQPPDPSLLAEAQRAVDRAIDITELISRYTKLDVEHSPEQVNLREIIEEVLSTNHLRIEKQGVALTLDCVPEVTVESNQQQLRIVLTNLLLNSLDALTDQPSPCILVTVEVVTGFARVIIEDNGAGIDPQYLPCVFDAFFSTKPSTGTGLGLATSKKIIESYGGSIEADSRPREWTRLTIRMRLTS